MKNIIVFISVTCFLLFLISCAPTAATYYEAGTKQFVQDDCNSVQNFEKASEMEIEDDGDCYPTYMLSLGLARYNCNDYQGALKAFQTVDFYVFKRSNREAEEKGFDFLKSKGNRLYELTEREETLLHYYMGMIHFKLGNYSDALVEFKKVDYIAEGNYSKLPLVALMRGLTYEELGEQDNALVAYKKIIEQNHQSPVGYYLAIRLEPDEGNRDVLKQMLSDSCGIQYTEPQQHQCTIIVLLEGKGTLDSDENIEIRYAAENHQVRLFDVVNPEFDFGKFSAGVIKEVGSALARDLMKNVASQFIPFGGSIVNAFLGGEKAEDRYCAILPGYFIADVMYVNSGIVNFEVNKYEDDELSLTKEYSFDNRDEYLFVSSF